MKKFIAVIFLVSFSCGLVNAQIEKGTVFLGTSTNISGSQYDMLLGTNNSIGISFSSMEYSGYDEKEKLTLLYFSPKIGYFVANNIVLGANLKLWSQSNDESKSSITAIGPFVRYYITNGKIVPIVEAEVTFGGFKETWDSDYSDGESKEKLTIVSLGAGLAFFINKHISVDYMAGYKSIVLKDSESGDDDTTLNNLGLVIGFTATF